MTVGLEPVLAALKHRRSHKLTMSTIFYSCVSFASFTLIQSQQNMSNYECSLQGIVIGQAQKEKFMQRLVGLCGNDSMVDLFEHELVFIPSSKMSLVNCCSYKGN